MTQLLYFADGLQKVGNCQRARELGLGYAFPESMGVVSADFSGAGPGGTQGCVFGVESERLGYYPDRQTWLKIPKGSTSHQLYVGFWKEERPGPEDLKRADQLPGSLVRLRDGKDWLVPIARGWNDRGDQASWYNALPKTLTIDANGEWAIGGVEPKYAFLWELANRWWTEMLGQEVAADGSVRFDFASGHDAAVSVLAANYRVTRIEAALLGLFDDQFYAAGAILNAMIEWPTFMAWAKKNLIEPVPAGLPSNAGEPATTTPTVPA
jgi:hypothetical protein